MTKYILHGGYTSAQNPENEAFYREITFGIKGKILVLLNYFSRKDEELRKLQKQDKERILKHSVNKNLSFEIAKPENLVKQLRKADVMYMRGRQTPRLIKKLSQTPNLESHFQGKIIVGSSAGVYVLVKQYYANDYKEIRDGLEILDLKAYCHFKPGNEDIIRKLRKCGDKNLPILILPDYKMAIIYK